MKKSLVVPVTVVVLVLVAVDGLDATALFDGATACKPPIWRLDRLDIGDW